MDDDIVFITEDGEVNLSLSSENDVAGYVFSMGLLPPESAPGEDEDDWDDWSPQAWLCTTRTT